MSMTLDRAMALGIEPEVTSPLPERLQAYGGLLMTSDAIAGIATIALCAALFHAAISAFFMLAATIGLAAALGRYRVSFAVSARDEWYATAGIALLGASVGSIACACFGLSWIAALAAGVLWTAMAGYATVRIDCTRRAGKRYAGISPHVRIGLRTSRWQIEQTLIRMLDGIFSSIALLVAIPVLAVIAVAVLVDDGAPVFFGQRRIGRDDREFIMYKIRTMRTDADSSWVSSDVDPRVTRVGKKLRRSSLDELPQLYNVLRGEMSLVGPRPEMQEYAASFTRNVENYWQRHGVRPGISGWSQLYLPRTVTPDDAPIVLGHDLFFVENAGVYLYMQCLVKTAVEIVSHSAR